MGPLVPALAALLSMACSDEPADGGDDLACPDAEPILDSSGAPTGLVACPSPFTADVYRVTAETCQPSESTCTESECDQCAEDEICAWGFGFGAECRCIRTCSTDDDCASDEVCRCGADGYGLMITECVAATCRTDADCPGGRCALSVEPCGLAQGLYCRFADDPCASHGDCGDDNHCSYDETAESWQCEPSAMCE
jgi:hypothetical protein